MIDVFLSELLAEVGEQESKRIATASAGYAESGPTFDPSGDYLCGTCIYRLMPDKCAIMTGKISMETGSCISWYKGEQAYQEPLKSQLSQQQLIYTERPNVKGFGCKRCEYSEDGYCVQWNMPVEPNACCFFNEGDDDVLAPGDKDSGEVSAGAEEVEAPDRTVDDFLNEMWAEALALEAGGPGSGCNPEVAVPGCGRPAKDRSLHKGSITGLFVRGSDAHKLYELLKDGNSIKKSEIRARLGKQAINSTLAAMAKRVKERGWELKVEGQRVWLDKKGVQNQPAENREEGKQPDYQNKDSDPVEQRLSTSPVKDSKRLGGGMNKSYKIVFADGSKGVFKPDVEDKEYVVRRNVTPGFDTEREAAAWQVAKLVGLEDMVPRSVIRRVEGERGVVLEWQEGKVADEVYGDDKYDGEKDLARAAVFDYVIGNEDRHSGNWVIGGGQKLKLIDHGLCFPDKGPYKGGNERIVAYARMNLHGHGSPKDLAAPYVAAEGKIALMLDKLGLPKGSARGISNRIQKLKDMTDWTNLREW